MRALIILIFTLFTAAATVVFLNALYRKLSHPGFDKISYPELIVAGFILAVFIIINISILKRFWRKGEDFQ